MRIYPALDLINGQCVRLYQGDYATVQRYASNPIDIAKNFADQGAELLHVVDLDGAKAGCLQQLPLVEKIMNSTGVDIQLGGGIRDRSLLLDIFAVGVKRAVIGSKAVSNKEVVASWLSEFGAEKLVLGLDVKLNSSGTPLLVTHAWLQENKVTLWEALEFYQKYGCLHVLCTDIYQDGTLKGPNCSLYAAILQRFPQIQLQASGGIATLADLKQLKNISVAATIIGKALYERKFSLTESLSAVRSL